MVVGPSKPLFGGDRLWLPNDWTSSDDTVRGGSSKSKMSCSTTDSVADFQGHLDIETLGGAGFASQRTTNDDLCFDLSEYDGIEMMISGADEKRYTLNLKDTLLARSANGREQATVSWESDFRVALSQDDPPMLIRFPWNRFKPTYRGKKVEDANPLDEGNIKRMSFMVRSFFGEQKGDFKLSIKSVSAYKGPAEPSLLSAAELQVAFGSADSAERFPFPYRDFPEYKEQVVTDEKHTTETSSKSKSSLLCGACGC